MITIVSFVTGLLQGMSEMSQFDIHDLFYALFQKTKHERQGGL